MRAMAKTGCCGLRRRRIEAGDEACRKLRWERYAVEEDTGTIALRQPHSVDDPLTGIAREGARRMLAAALRAEADAFVADLADARLPDGRQRVVKHGQGPERGIRTGRAVCRCGGRRSATGPRGRLRPGFGLPLPSCPAGRGDPVASLPFFRSCICAPSRRAPCRKPWRLFSGWMRPTFLPGC